MMEPIFVDFAETSLHFDFTIIAVDFDGTLTQEGTYPFSGDPNIPLIDRLRALREDGHKVILWTCRENTALSEAVVFCQAYGLIFDAVNDNLPEVKERIKGNPRKIIADLYIDDRNYDGFKLPFKGRRKKRRNKW